MAEIQISYLPFELLEIILGYANSSTLKTCLEIPYLTKIVKKELYQRCFKILIELEMNKTKAKEQLDNGKIDFRDCPNIIYITDKSIIELAENCLGLTEINLTDCHNITDTSVIALAEHCPELMKIFLDYCYKITDNSIIALAQGCQGLIEICLSDCKNITDISLIALAMNCLKLEYIDLTCWGSNITTYAKKLLRDNGVYIY